MTTVWCCATAVRKDTVTNCSWVWTIRILGRSGAFCNRQAFFPLLMSIEEVKNQWEPNPPPQKKTTPVIVGACEFGFYFLKTQLKAGANCLPRYGPRVHNQIEFPFAERSLTKVHCLKTPPDAASLISPNLIRHRQLFFISVLSRTQQKNVPLAALRPRASAPQAPARAHGRPPYIITVRAPGKHAVRGPIIAICRL